MSATKICEKPCETCMKEGLPILLTRYAVLHESSKAPKVSGQLGDAALNDIPLKSQAHYGLRLLRSGYVYVYDEARKSMDEYFVTNDGFLTKMPYRQIMLKNAIQKPATEFQCARKGVFTTAGFISIPKPKYATTVWICFSDAAWTNLTYQQHRSDAGLREQHMRPITIKGGKVASQDYTAPIEEVSQHVAEYHAKTNAAPLKQTSPFQFNKRADNEQLKATIKLVAPEGGAAIVALHDPVGVAAEIAALMEMKLKAFKEQTNIPRKNSVASTISALKNQIKAQAKSSEFRQKMLEAMRIQYSGLESANPSNPALWGTQEETVLSSHQANEIRKGLTKDYLNKVADDTWKSYTHDKQGRKRIDEGAAIAWQKEWDAKLRQFDEETIVPLAKAHIAWQKSDKLVNHLSCNYDTQDLASGEAYTAVVSMIIKTTGDKNLCHQLYVDWLSRGDLSKNNLAMRALVFNQDKLADEIKKSNEAGVDMRILPNDASFNVIKEGLLKLPNTAQVAMGALLDNLGGAILSYLDKFDSGKAKPAAAAAFAGVNGRQMIRIDIEGTKEDFIKAHRLALLQMEPNFALKAHKANLAEFYAAMENEIELLKIEGVPIEGTKKMRWLSALDKEVIKNIPADVKGQAYVEQLSKTIRTPQQLGKFDHGAWRRLIGGDLRVGMVTGLLQIYSISKTVSDLSNAMQFEQTDTLMRLIGGGVSMAATFSSISGSALEKMGVKAMVRIPFMKNILWSALLKGAGDRFFGPLGGLIVGVADIMRANEEDLKGNKGLSRLYYISAGLGISLGIGMIWLTTMGPVGWLIMAIALALFIVVTLVIEKEKDNKLQAWLARCYFGVASNKYDSYELEQAEYELVFK